MNGNNTAKNRIHTLAIRMTHIVNIILWAETVPGSCFLGGKGESDEERQKQFESMRSDS